MLVGALSACGGDDPPRPGRGATAPGALLVERALAAFLAGRTTSRADLAEESNVAGEVPAVEMRDFMLPELTADVRKLEWWTDKATLHPQQAAVTYAEGAIVVYQGTLYRALAVNSGKAPDQNAALWEELPPPADDVRLTESSPHAGLGVRWPPAIP